MTPIFIVVSPAERLRMETHDSKTKEEAIENAKEAARIAPEKTFTVCVLTPVAEVRATEADQIPARQAPPSAAPPAVDHDRKSKRDRLT